MLALPFEEARSPEGPTSGLCLCNPPDEEISERVGVLVKCLAPPIRTLAENSRARHRATPSARPPVQHCVCHLAGESPTFSTDQE